MKVAKMSDVLTLISVAKYCIGLEYFKSTAYSILLREPVLTMSDTLALTIIIIRII